MAVAGDQHHALGRRRLQHGLRQRGVAGALAERHRRPARGRQHAAVTAVDQRFHGGLLRRAPRRPIEQRLQFGRRRGHAAAHHLASRLARQVAAGDARAAVERSLEQRPVQRPAPGAAVEPRGVDHCLDLPRRGGDGPVVAAVDLLEDDARRSPVGQQGAQQRSALAVLLGVVVHLAEQHEAGLAHHAVGFCVRRCAAAEHGGREQSQQCAPRAQSISARRSRISTAKKPNAAMRAHLTITTPRRRQATSPVPTYIAKHNSPAASRPPMTKRRASIVRDPALPERAHHAGASSAKPEGAAASSSKLSTS
jgi:hypothetical protein